MSTKRDVWHEMGRLQVVATANEPLCNWVEALIEADEDKSSAGDWWELSPRLKARLVLIIENQRLIRKTIDEINTELHLGVLARAEGVPNEGV